MMLNEDDRCPETLRRAGATEEDWLLALTSADEVNVVASGLIAAESPAVRRLAWVESPFYFSLSEAQRKAFGLQVLINPAAETADAIGRIVEEGFAEDVIPLHGGRLQLRTVVASSVPASFGKSLREVKSSSGNGVLLVSIVRDRGIVVPDGNFFVEATDILYLLSTPATLDGFLGQVPGVKSVSRRVLVIGATSIGERLVERFLAKSRRGFWGRLFGTKQQLTLLDTSPDQGKSVAHAYEGGLESIGVECADLVVCVTEPQSFNVVTAQLVKELGAKRSLAVTLNDRYMAVGTKFDVDALVSVKSVVAAAVLETVRRGNIKPIHQSYEDAVALRLAAGSRVSGLSLRQIDLPKGVFVAFVMQGEELVVPTGATVLNGGDIIGFVSRKKSIPGLEIIFGSLRGD